MLGGRTPAQFVQLPLERRQALYRRNLVQNAPVIIEEGDDDEMNPDIASGVCLRQQYFMGFNELGKQIVKEAAEDYYGENDFRVRLHWLCEFKTDVLGDHKTAVDTASLVRGTLKVYADLHDNNHIYASEPGYGVAALPKWSIDRLRDLLLFTRARRVVLVLRHGAASVMKQTIEDMTPALNQLHSHLGAAFTVEKQLQGNDWSFWNAQTVQLE